MGIRYGFNYHTDEVYFIGDNGTALNTDNNTFCSEECILKYIMADSMPVEDWIG